ncbi:histone H5, AT hook-like protein [Tanacetum coccineum]|uniref:Histone H5, AT hook-like protein n=1 Tax=Tanacetum coccineum TaxID=301880 RepID=A0ABQ5I9S5_9ASTR
MVMGSLATPGAATAAVACCETYCFDSGAAHHVVLAYNRGSPIGQVFTRCYIEGAAPVTVSLVGNVLRPRGRPKRFGRPVVDGVSVKGSRRPPGRTSVIKVTNFTGLELARQAKGSVSVTRFPRVQGVKDDKSPQTILEHEFVELTTLEHGRCATTNKLAIHGDGIVLNSGDGVSQALPIYEGVVRKHVIERVNLARADITSYLTHIVCRMKEKLTYVGLDYEKELETANNADVVVQPCSRLNKELRAKAHSSMRITVDTPRGLQWGIVPCFSPKLPKGRLAGNDMMTENVLLNGQKKRLHYVPVVKNRNGLIISVRVSKIVYPSMRTAGVLFKSRSSKFPGEQSFVAAADADPHEKKT